MKKILILGTLLGLASFVNAAPPVITSFKQIKESARDEIVNNAPAFNAEVSSRTYYDGLLEASKLSTTTAASTYAALAASNTFTGDENTFNGDITVLGTTSGTYVGDGSGLSGVVITEADPVWTAASVDYVTLAGANTLSNPANVFYGDGSNLSGVVGSESDPVWTAASVDYVTLAGANTLSNPANVFYGDGSNLSGVVITEADPVWTAASVDYVTLAGANTLSNPANVFYGDGSNLTGIVAGDNLGSHIATTTLNMGLFSLTGTTTIGRSDTYGVHIGSVQYAGGNQGGLFVGDTGIWTTGDAGDDTPELPNARGRYAVDLQLVRVNTVQVASGESSSIGGGIQNTASGGFSTVAGGGSNTASNNYSTVGGGSSNTASSFGSVVAGGYTNTASGNESVVAGGDHNTASGYYSAILGGGYNTASGEYSTTVGGYKNVAAGVKSSAQGNYAKATSSGTWVWSGTANGSTYNEVNTPDAFAVFAYGGVLLNPMGIGNISIGTTQASAKLNVSGDLIVGTPYMGLAAPANGALIYGNVGIGTSNVTQKFSVLGNAAINGYIYTSGIYNSGASDRARINMATTGVEVIRATDDVGTTLSVTQSGGGNTADIFTIANATSTVLTVDVDGNLGIGTTNPSALLDVSDNFEVTASSIGFYGASPVALYETVATTTGFTQESGDAINVNSTFTGDSGSTAYTIGDIVRALKKIGIMKD